LFSMFYKKQNNIDIDSERLKILEKLIEEVKK